MEKGQHRSQGKCQGKHADRGAQGRADDRSEGGPSRGGKHADRGQGGNGKHRG